MATTFPVLLIAIGVVVLLLGKRLAVLGAAVGALLGVVLLQLFSASGDTLLQFGLVIGLAVVGFLFAGAAKGIVDIVLLVIGALAGAAIALGFLDLFNATLGWVNWLFAIIGGFIGLMMIRRFSDWAMVVLAGLVGGLLVTRGLTVWLPALEGGLGTLLVLVLAGGGIGYQGGLLGRRGADEPVPAGTASAAPAAPAGAAPAGTVGTFPATTTGTAPAGTVSASPADTSNQSPPPPTP